MTCCCFLADFMFLLQHFGPLTLIPLTQVYWYGGKTYCWGFHINDSSPVLEILLEIIKILQLAWDISTTLLFQDACLKGKNILAPTPANKKIDCIFDCFFSFYKLYMRKCPIVQWLVKTYLWIQVKPVCVNEILHSSNWLVVDAWHW